MQNFVLSIFGNSNSLSNQRRKVETSSLDQRRGSTAKGEREHRINLKSNTTTFSFCFTATNNTITWPHLSLTTTANSLKKKKYGKVSLTPARKIIYHFYSLARWVHKKRATLSRSEGSCSFGRTSNQNDGQRVTVGGARAIWNEGDASWRTGALTELCGHLIFDVEQRGRRRGEGGLLEWQWVAPQQVRAKREGHSCSTYIRIQIQRWYLHTLQRTESVTCKNQGKVNHFQHSQ